MACVIDTIVPNYTCSKSRLMGALQIGIIITRCYNKGQSAFMRKIIHPLPFRNEIFCLKQYL